jgi:hypothetical protein
VELVTIIYPLSSLLKVCYAAGIHTPIIFSTFCLDAKTSKKIKEKRMLRLFSGPTHMTTLLNCNFILFWNARDSVTAA